MYIRRCSEKEREIDEHKDDESRTQRNLGFVSFFFFCISKMDRERERDTGHALYNKMDVLIIGVPVDKIAILINHCTKTLHVTEF